MIALLAAALFMALAWAPFFWCCCSSCGQVCFTVDGPTGCGGSGSSLPLAGAVVTLTLSGVTVGTCTTDSSGMCCIPITLAATYSYAVVPPTGYRMNSASGTVAATCTTNNVTVTLTIDTGDLCVGCCPLPVPGTLFATTGAGTVTLTWNGIGWAGCISYSSANIWSSHSVACPAGCSGTLTLGTNISGTFPINVLLTCQTSAGVTAWNFSACFIYEYGAGRSTTCSGPFCVPTDPIWGYTSAACPSGCTGTGGVPGCVIEDVGGTGRGEIGCASVPSSVSCDTPAFELSGTFSASSFTEPTFGQTIPIPFGGSYTVTS